MSSLSSSPVRSRDTLVSRMTISAGLPDGHPGRAEPAGAREPVPGPPGAERRQQRQGDQQRPDADQVGLRDEQSAQHGGEARRDK